MSRPRHDEDAREAEAHGEAAGREAEEPTELGRGWFDVARRSLRQVKMDNVQILAAGVAFWFFIALVPTIVAVVSIYGLVGDPANVSEQIDRFGSALPRGIVTFLDEQLRAITTTSRSKLGFGLAASVIAALYSSSKGSRALIAATNAAYDEEETRGYVRLRVLAMTFTLGGVVIALAGLTVIGGAPALGRRLGPVGTVLTILLGWPLVLVLFAISLGVLYRFAPDRDNPRWTWVTPGAILATLVWLAGTLLFALYANVMGNFNETYGSLAGIAVLLLWLLVTAFAILLGAEVNGEAERQTRRDTTEGKPSPLGQRAAFAADTVAGETPERPEP